MSLCPSCRGWHLPARALCVAVAVLQIHAVLGEKRALLKKQPLERLKPPKNNPGAAQTPKKRPWSYSNQQKHPWSCSPAPALPRGFTESEKQELWLTCPEGLCPGASPGGSPVPPEHPGTCKARCQAGILAQGRPTGLGSSGLSEKRENRGPTWARWGCRGGSSEGELPGAATWLLQLKLRAGMRNGRLQAAPARRGVGRDGTGSTPGCSSSSSLWQGWDPRRFPHSSWVGEEVWVPPVLPGKPCKALQGRADLV